MRPDSPEERLLRLIKGKRKKRTDSEVVQPQDKKPFLERVSKDVFLKTKIFKPSFLKQLNVILVIILVLSLIYLADIILFRPPRDIDSIIQERKPASLPAKVIGREKLLWPAPEDFSLFSKDIKNKNLFSSRPTGGQEKELTSPVDVYKRFNLVGLVTGAEPQAIIEDKDTQKTHYLYKGQSFNGVTVTAVGEGKVTLDYGGKEIVLVL